MMKLFTALFALLIVNLCVISIQSQPVNDLCLDAILLNCGDHALGSNVTATAIDAQTACQGPPGTGVVDSSKGVWYNFVGDGDSVTVTTSHAGTNFDTELQIFFGSCGALTCLGGDDDGGFSLTSSMRFLTMLSTTYYIYVDGNLMNGLNTGDFELSLSCDRCTVPVVTDVGDMGVGTLRELVSCAPSGATITFDPSTDGFPIQLISGEIQISNKFLTIEGNGSASTSIDGGLDQMSRLFQLDDGAIVIFKNMSFINGGGAVYAGDGGAFSCIEGSILRLANCHLTGNVTLGAGAVIHMTDGGYKSVNCKYENNSSGEAGVICLKGDAFASVQQCLIFDNTSDGYAVAGVESDTATLEMLQSTMADNTSTTGMETIHSIGTVRLSNNIFNVTGLSALNNSGTFTATNNLLDAAGIIPLNSNFVGHPYFVNAGARNYQIQDSSFAVDAGQLLSIIDACDVDNDGITAEFIDLDIGGNDRTNKCRIDIGAFENVSTETVFYVTNVNDEGRGSFRDILNCAQDSATVRFLAVTDGFPILPTSGQFNVVSTINIIGNGPLKTILDGSNNGGGRIALINSGEFPTFRHITFRNAGSLSTFGGAIISFGDSKYIDCVFHDNNGSSGGGIGGGTLAKLEIFNCVFYDNNCNTQGGAVSLNNDSKIVNSLFYSNNSNSIGGAVTCAGGTTMIINNTFVSNTASLAGGGILNNAVISKLENNIIAGNTSPNGPNFFDNGAASVTSSQNNLMNSTAGSGLVSGVIAGSPIYINAGAGNYQLTGASLGVNMGDFTLLPTDTCDIDEDLNSSETLDLDLAANPRVAGCESDIGAYEYVESACDTGQCTLPISIACGAPLSGNTFNGAKSHSAYNCSAQDASGREKVYEFVASAPGDITITLSNLNVDLDLYVLSNCANSTSCLAYGDQSIMTSVVPGSYFIIVDGVQDVVGSYTLSVNCAGTVQPCLENNITLNSPISPDGSYHAIDDIMSNATVINSGVEYKAGNSILLNAEFEVSSGIEFDAIIEDCP